MANPTPQRNMLGIIVALLGVLVVVVVIVFVVLLVNINNNSKSPAGNYVAQSTNTENPSASNTESPTNTPDIPVPSEQTTNPTPITSDNLIAVENIDTPALDKIITSKETGISMAIPSDWDYSEEYGQLVIDSGKDNIHLSAQVNQRWIFYPYESYDNSEFTFANGYIGTYSKDSVAAIFSHPMGAHYLFFVVDFYEDEEWYSQNEELIYALARTLSIQDNEAYEAFLVQEQFDADAKDAWLAQEWAAGEQQDQLSESQSGQQQPTSNTPSQAKTLLVTATSEAIIVSQPDSTGFFKFKMVCKSCGWTKDSSMIATHGSFGASSFKCSKCVNFIKSSFRGVF